MTDETKPGAMMAQRLEEIRARAAGYLPEDDAARRLADEDVPALLSALEEARTSAREMELERDGARALEQDFARRLDVTIEKLRQRVREKEAAEARAVTAERERDALAARVAELEGALATARNDALGAAVGACLDYAAACRSLPDDAEHDAEVEALKADAAESLAKEIEAMKSAAQPEKALGLPWPVTANDMHALSLAFPDVESNSVDNVCGCFTVAECLADSLDKVTCLDCLREIARQRAPKAAAEKAPARVTTEDMERLRALERETAESVAEDAKLCAELGLAAPAPVQVFCSPRVAERAAHPEPRCQCGHIMGCSAPELHAPDCPERARLKAQHEVALAADPLCARDLGGTRCGHTLSEHPGQTITGLPLGCHHALTFSGGVRGWCPCPGFVPEPPPRLTDAQQRDAAALMATTEPAPEDGPGRDPDMDDPEPSGVVDHGTEGEPARTCGTCAHGKVSPGGSVMCPDDIAGLIPMRPSDSCFGWTRRGSTTERGETP